MKFMLVTLAVVLLLQASVVIPAGVIIGGIRLVYDGVARSLH